MNLNFLSQIRFLWQKKLFVLVVLAVAIFGLYFNFSKTKTAETTYQTAKVERGTLVVSISSSGTITSGNNTSINTKVSGTVKEVYVANGDLVVKGQKIAEVSLDDVAKERQTAAWVKYLEAVEGVKDAEKAKTTADIQMWKDRQAILDAEEEVKNKNLGGINPDTGKAYTLSEQTVVDKTLIECQEAFAASEKKYLDADFDIAAANAKVASALRDYQENSAEIIAPSSGTISDLTLTPGLIINANSSTSSTSGSTIISPQTVGKISSSESRLTASVNLSEIDIVKIKANQKVNLTLDAYPDRSFTGKVLAINTSGSVSSGVTTYPVTVLLDPVNLAIYPNMAVTAEIITSIQNNVLLVPSEAVTTTDNSSTVQVKKDNQIKVVTVEIGESNDSQTEIVSGLTEGDEVITSVIKNNIIETNSTETSPFSGIGRFSSRNSSNYRSSGGEIHFGPGGGL